MERPLGALEQRPFLRHVLFCTVPLYFLVRLLFGGICYAGCLDCHDLGLTVDLQSVHEPYRCGECSSCHGDHGGGGVSLMAVGGNLLCLSCHDAGADPFKESHSKLPVDRSSCINCHHPHASEKTGLLRPTIHSPLSSGDCYSCHALNGRMRCGNVASTCFLCHEERLFQGISRHAPLADGECLSCHNPHGSAYPFLLISPYQTGRTVPFSEATRGLCFSCHEVSSFTNASGRADTGFKDLDHNFHYRHVAGQGIVSPGAADGEGMACRGCHLPHASLRPHLIRDNFDCGEGVMCLRLAYFKRDGVGTCLSGCHKSASYSNGRVEAGSAPVDPGVSGGKVAEVSLLVQATGSLCIDCHKNAWLEFQKRTMHDPVKRKRCEGCHVYYGPDKEMILMSRKGEYCPGCHDGTKSSFKAAHRGIEVMGSNCVRCHDPHASDNKSLLYAVSHKPYGDRLCVGCHDSNDGTWYIGRPTNELCASCHKDRLDRDNLHGAVTRASCTGCHSPHAAALDNRLVSAAPGLCYRCHEQKDHIGLLQHDPVKKGNCFSCHDVHQGKGASHLVRVGNQVCFSCHDAFGDSFGEHHSKLPVTKLLCLSCHVPHASDRAGLLSPTVHNPLAHGKCDDCHGQSGQLKKGTVVETCFECHESWFFKGASMHEPVAVGKCTSCHDQHWSPYSSLLKASYPTGRQELFGEEKYGLCFSCHKASAFTVDGSGADTGFKNDRENLHYRHVVRQRAAPALRDADEGMTCRTCHLPHASLRPNLIRQNLDCGEGVMCLKLGYYVRDGVGTCMAGCHQSASYSPGGVRGASAGAIEESGKRLEEARKLPEALESPCLECHQDAWRSFGKSTVHDPVRKKRCGDCHLFHGLDKKLMLVAYEWRLCMRCHDENTDAFRETHGGLEVRGSHCVRCHDPHASNTKSLLYAVDHGPYERRSCSSCHDSDNGTWAISKPINQLCGGCHGEQLDREHLHGATAKASCTGCHSPHASKLDKRLVSDTPDLCYRCHGQDDFTRKYSHEPVKRGECGFCHDAHGSENHHILVASYPKSRYQDFRKDLYDLCFSCHDETPFREQENAKTSFRKGEVNLHYLHVNAAGKTRAGRKAAPAGCACSNCHQPHSTDQPDLIRWKIDCDGVFCLNLAFRKIGNRGRCSRGCHTPQTYGDVVN